MMPLFRLETNPIMNMVETSERARYDAVHCDHAASVLYGRRTLEAECTAGGCRSCVFGSAFHACLWEFEGHLTPEVE